VVITLFCNLKGTKFEFQLGIVVIWLLILLLKIFFRKISLFIASYCLFFVIFLSSRLVARAHTINGIMLINSV